MNMKFSDHFSQLLLYPPFTIEQSPILSRDGISAMDRRPSASSKWKGALDSAAQSIVTSCHSECLIIDTWSVMSMGILPMLRRTMMSIADFESASPHSQSIRRPKISLLIFTVLEHPSYARRSIALVLLYLSQHRLPCKLNLPRCFARFPTSFTNTYGTSFSQFHLIFDSWERAGAVVWKVYAG